MTPAPLAAILFGATATGKTELALDVAGHLDIEVISADSRQVYRELDIGTAKPTPEQRQRVPTHLVDFLELDQVYNAARFAKDCLALCHDIRSRGRIPLIVGGAGFYLKILRDGLFEANIDEDELQRTRVEVQTWSTERMRDELRRLDPERLRHIHTNDRYRLSRALEICLLTGRSVTELTRERVPPSHEFLEFRLDIDRGELHRRIEQRTAAMLRDGWIQETERALERHGAQVPGLATLGYPPIVDFLNGAVSRQQMQENIVRDTRRYARQQEIWFRKWDFAESLQVGNSGNVESLCREVRKRFAIDDPPSA